MIRAVQNLKLNEIADKQYAITDGIFRERSSGLEFNRLEC